MFKESGALALRETETKDVETKQELDWKDGYLNFDLHPHLEDPEFRKQAINYKITFPIGWDGKKVQREYIKNYPLALMVNSEESNARANSIHVNHVKQLSSSIQDIGLIKNAVISPVGEVPEGGHRELAARLTGSEFIEVESVPFEGKKISSAADTQVHYSDVQTAFSVARGYKKGLSIEKLASATSRSPRTTRFFTNLINATPELIYAMKNDIVSVTHGCELARLNKKDQNYELREFVNSDEKLAARKLRKKVTAGIKLSQGNPTIDSLREISLSRITSKKKFQDFLQQDHQTPSYHEDFSLSSVNLEPTSTEKRSNHEKILQRLTLMHKSKFLGESFFDNLETRLNPLFVKPLLNGHSSLTKAIIDCAQRNHFTEEVLTYEEARKWVEQDVISGKTVSMKYPRSYVPNGKSSLVKPSPNNVRGKRKDTIESAYELVPSIKKHGILQPILCHINAQGEHEVIVGNRRYEASLLAGLEEIPYFLITQKLTDKQIIELQLIEDSQKLYTIFERANLFENIYKQNLAEGKTKEESLQDLVTSSNYSKSTVNKYLSYHRALSSEVKSLYSFSGDKMLKQDFLDALIDFEKDKQNVLVPISVFRGNVGPKAFSEISNSIYNLEDSLFGDEIDTNLVLLNEAQYYIEHNLKEWNN